MKKYEALYDWPRAQIEVLADSDGAETYASALNAEMLDHFVEITEKLRSQSSMLYHAKESRKHASGWPELRDLVDNFAEKFANFPGAQFVKLRLFLLLCEVISQLEPDLDSEDLDGALLSHYSVSPSIPVAWFTRQNGSAFERSLVLLKPASISEIQGALNEESASAQLLFYVIATLSSSNVVLPEAMAILKSGVTDSADVESFVKLHLLMDGRPVHVPKTVARMPSVVDRDIVDVRTAYGQWGELLWVLSEYNSRGESLLKFLTLYQAFESLMFKFPIVKLERAKNGAMFSLREFKRLYSLASVKEQEALENLFKSIFLLQVGTTTIRAMVETDWSALVHAVGSHEITQEIEALGIKLGGGFAGPNCAVNLAKIVYVVRNSVVHNKETEFHLTSESLSANMRRLVEDFLLPTLEKVVFWVISAKNDEVWYVNQKLTLY